MSQSEQHCDVKHYGILAAAGALSVRGTPQNPNRTSLTIKNNGPFPGNFRFDNNCEGNLSDWIFAVGESFTWHSPCPLQSLNFFSTGGCTFTVIEGNEIRSGPHG